MDSPVPAGGPSERALVRRYYWYRATLSVGFVTPVFTLFLLRSLTFTQVGVLSALYSVLAVVGEVPTGYVGDRLGRRASLLLSVGFTVASLAGFVIVEGFLPYAVLYALWALALTFRSGSLDAWLYDTLDRRLDADRFTHVRGRGDAVQRWTAAVSTVAGGLLYGVAPTAPFVAAVAFNSLGVVALLSLPKNAQYVSADGEGGAGGGTGADATDDRPDFRTVVTVASDRLARPPLRSVVLYVGLFYAVVGVAGAYVQPMTVETLAPVAADLGVPLPAGSAVEAARSGEAGAVLASGLGVLYALLTAVSSVGGYYAGAVEDRLGVRRAVLLVPGVTVVACILPVWVGLAALPAFAAMRTASPVLQPITNGYVNDHVSGVGRATVLSVVSMVTLLLRTPLALGAGVVADRTTATTAVAVLGGLFLVCGTAIWLAGDVAPAAGDDTDRTGSSPS
jgi:MFS family permease